LPGSSRASAPLAKSPWQVVHLLRLDQALPAAILLAASGLSAVLPEPYSLELRVVTRAIVVGTLAEASISLGLQIGVDIVARRRQAPFPRHGFGAGKGATRPADIGGQPSANRQWRLRLAQA